MQQGFLLLQVLQGQGLWDHPSGRHKRVTRKFFKIQLIQRLCGCWAVPTPPAGEACRDAAPG